MKPNGRRRWRKWAKAYRHGHHVTYLQASDYWQAHDGQRVICGWPGARWRRHAGRQPNILTPPTMRRPQVNAGKALAVEPAAPID